MLLAEVAHLIKRAPKPKPWINGTMTAVHQSTLDRECSAPPQFDQLGSKRYFHALLKAGRIKPVVKTQAAGTVIALLDHPGQEDEIPWDLWSQILQVYGSQHITIYLCAHTAKRKFPKAGKPIRPLHINGGYAYPCNPHCIFIFRAEDATRVLLHELQHATCCDKQRHDIDTCEAETEAWAELLWCGFMSKGNFGDLKKIVERQGTYMNKQNLRIQQHHMTDAHREFPWRYTIGKADVWERWGLLSGRIVANDCCSATVKSQQSCGASATGTSATSVPLSTSDSLRLTFPFSENPFI